MCLFELDCDGLFSFYWLAAMEIIHRIRETVERGNLVKRYNCNFKYFIYILFKLTRVIALLVHDITHNLENWSRTKWCVIDTLQKG